MGVQITNEMIAAAQAAQAKHGIPASITLAQITLESGGKYQGGLSALAYNYNNLFGQKAGKNEAGITLQTGEYGSNGYYTTSAKFRVYDSVNQSIMEHGEKWGTSRVGQQASVEDYAKALKAKGYATDPQYAEKLISIIDRDNLRQYDTVQTGTAVDTVETLSVQQTGFLQEQAEEAAKDIASPVLTVILAITVAVLGVWFMYKAFITGTGKEGKTA